MTEMSRAGVLNTVAGVGAPDKIAASGESVKTDVSGTKKEHHLPWSSCEVKTLLMLARLSGRVSRRVPRRAASATRPLLELGIGGGGMLDASEAVMAGSI